MLTALHIENIAVIKEVDIELGAGLTVLTGETGAGKSIIIDSIHLLTGAKTEKGLVRSGENAAQVTAIFSAISPAAAEELAKQGIEPDEDGALLVTRRLTSDGRTSIRMNGRPVTVAMQREIGRLLINIHGQHDNQQLLNPSSHLGLLDSYAQLEPDLKVYEAAYDAMTETQKKIDALMNDAKEKARMTELLEYQIADIESAKLKPKEEEELTLRRDRLKNLERISKQVKIVYKSLYRSEKGISAYEQLGRAADALTALADLLPDADEMLEKLNSFRYDLEDIALTVSEIAEVDCDDPEAELDRLETRLDKIASLERKYGSNIAEILAYRDEMKAKLEEINSSEERLDELNRELKRENEEVVRLAAGLTAKRRNAAETLSRRVMDELKFLDMAKVRFSVSIRRAGGEDGVRYHRQGGDEVEFLIATNPGEPLMPLSRIASGGELSRIMLALKSVFADRDNTETLIYDEIDTGVSGKTAQKIGIRLHQTAQNDQVLCITHSAQIAALADSHLLIQKQELDGRSITTVKKLDYDGRINELSRIMGGMEITDNLRESARELIEQGKKI